MRKPNAVQKLIHRFFMLRPVTAFFAPRVHHVDKVILKLTRGKFTASEILGWSIIQLTTIGAKTNQPRTLPLVGMFDKDRIALVASSFGRKQNPGWYYNLKTHPNVRSNLMVIREPISLMNRLEKNTTITGRWRFPFMWGTTNTDNARHTGIFR